MKNTVMVGTALALALSLAPTLSLAQTYPHKPVRIITGYPPGGPTELIGRVLADHLTQSLGQPFIVEGKPGAAGNVAGEFVANAAPDGHTLNIVGLGLIATNYDLYKNMSYDPAKVFAPISLLVRLPVILEVSSKIPAATFQEFLAYARQPNVKLNHGSPGIGTLPHLAAELFRMKYGFKSEHVPYKGSGPFAQGMMQRELEWSFDVPQTALALVKNNSVRVIAVSSAKRYEPFPDAPTLTELGMEDSVWDTWFGIVAPVATPKAIIDRLHAEIDRGWKDPRITQRLKFAGLEPATTTPEETSRIFASDRVRWSAVVRAAGLKVE